MINMFCLLCWINLMPLEYYPFFDTYEALKDRAYAQESDLGQGCYDGYVLPYITMPLQDELDRVYEQILQNLNLDSEKLKKELHKDEISISDKQFEQIVNFRKKERDRLEKEQNAWLDSRREYVSYIYNSFGDASGRLTFPCAAKNYWLFQRIKELKDRYPSIFNKDIQYKHLWGEWELEDKAEKIKFERTSNAKKRLLTSKGDISKEGFYELDNGRLIFTSEKKASWIDIIDKNEALFLQFYEEPKISPSDNWLYKQIEKTLMREMHSVYQEIIDSLRESIKKMKEENELGEFTDQYIKYSETQIVDIKNAQKAWLKWLSASFDNRELMYPDGTVQSLRHSRQRNRAIYEWVLSLQYEYFIGNQKPKLITDNFINEGTTKWECPNPDEVWVLSKGKDALYSYHILKGKEVVEKGNFYFEESDLIFNPTLSKRVQPQPKEMTKSEGLLAYKYLFTPLKKAKSFKKISPL